MDLVSNPSATKVIIVMEHTDKKGNPKILNQCQFPLTGKACVSRIITELVCNPYVPPLLTSLLTLFQCVFDVNFTTGLTMIEIADGVTVDEVRAKTEAPFRVADDLKPML